MSTVESSGFVRLRVELVLEIDDPDAVTRAALDRLADEAGAPAGERAHAETVVRQDTAEALAHLIDPFDLVKEVPGIELAQASWSGEHVDHDPEAEGRFPGDGLDDADDEDDPALV